MKKIFDNRSSVLKPIQCDESGYRALQQLWTAHLQGLGDMAKELDLPESMVEIIDIINACICKIIK